jgi:predicted ATPase/DNA-binding SARP family transcriptional activator
MLGPLVVAGAERPRAFGGPRQRAVLLDLMIHANEVLSPDALIEDLWEGRAPQGAMTTLKVYASHLRAALAAYPGARLESRRPGYVLEMEPDQIDARRFERLVAEAAGRQAEDPVGARKILVEALALWRGPALADIADLAFARPEATRLEELRRTATSWRIETDLRAGHGAEVIGELEVLVHAHPLHEGFWAQLMRALYASGRRAEALRAYGSARRILGEELGIDPSRSLQELEQAMLLQQLPAEPAASLEPARPPSNLPVPTTSFVGRLAELREVSELLNQRRLVTIVGEGGSGKTRLALEVAGRWATPVDGEGPAPRGPWLVELASLTGADQAWHALASVMAVREDPATGALAAVADAIGGDDMLVVLDNCEHLVTGIVGPIAELLARCPGLRILTTSREALEVSGETLWRIPSLALPPADARLPAAAALGYDGVRLLVERARAADSRFALADERVPAVLTICRRLDGMPLALELAAARLRVLSPEEIAGRLDDRFALLAATSRTVAPRQRSLEAAVEWSYELLSPAERLLFQRLSVFAGSFSLQQVEAICSGPSVAAGEVIDLLGNLVAKSLVVRVPRSSGPARFRLLETLRHYAAGRLGAGAEAEALRGRHAEFFVARCEEVSAHRFGPGWHGWLERLDDEYDEGRSALAWLLEAGTPGAALRLATSLWRYWDYRYLTAEGRAFLAAALARPGGDASLRRRALAGAAYLAWMEDDLDGAEAACAAGLALPETEDDPEGRAGLLAIQGEVARHRGGQAERAWDLCHTAAGLFHQAGDTWGEADAYRILTLLAWDRADLAEAAALGETCLRLFESCGDAERSAGSRSLLAGVARDTGDLSRAARLYEESLAQFRQAQEPWGTAQMIRSLGTVVLAQGDHQRAYHLGQECLAMHTQLGNKRGIAEALKLMGDAALQLGRAEEADRLCQDALERFRARGLGPDTRAALRSAGEAALAVGEADRAALLLTEAMGSAAPGGEPALAVARGLAEVRRDRLAAGLALLDEAIEGARATGDTRTEAAAHEALAEAALTAGQPEAAARHLSAGARLRAASGEVATPVVQDRARRTFAALEAARPDLAAGVRRTEAPVVDLRDSGEPAPTGPDDSTGSRASSRPGPPGVNQK